MFKVALVGWGLAGFGAGLLLVSSGQVRLPGWHLPFAVQQSATNHPEIQAIVFGSDSGLVLNYIKPDKTTAFDFMIGQLKTAMEESHESTLCDQAARWRVLRSPDSGPDATAVYVFAVESGRRSKDYRFSTLIAEAIRRNPDEFYRRLVDLYASPQNVINVGPIWAARGPNLERDQIASHSFR